MTPEIDLSKTYYGDAQDYKFNEITAVILNAEGVAETPDTTEVTVIGKDSSGNVTAARGITVPAGEAGYALEAAFVDIDKSANTHKLYRNIGTAAVADWNLVGTVEAGEIEANALAADATGRATMQTGFFNTATIISKFVASSFTDAVVTALFAASSFTKAIVDSVFAAGSIAAAKLENPQAYDAGSVMRNVLRMANDAVDAQTATIGADVYECEVVNTDSTDDTQGGEFNNTTDPLTVDISAANYANLNGTLVVGDLIRIENEIMAVTVVAGDDVTFSRGASNTTAAAHADAVDIYIGDGITGGNIAVGVVATLTPAVWTPALAADINARGTESVVATSLQTGAEMLLESADAVGGSPAASATATATTETLAGANNEWAEVTLVSGKAAGVRQLAIFEHTVDQTEVDLAAVRLPLTFTPSAFIVQAYDANGLFLETLTDQITIVSNRIEFDFTGGTNLAATNVLRVLAWN